MRSISLAILAVALLVSACNTRPISDSGYPQGRSYGSAPANPLYRGELSEFEVIGVDAGATASDKEIADALDKEIADAFAGSASRISLSKGASIMLIQSGAMIPDAEMIENMETAFSVTVFSGVPQGEKQSNASYSHSLRLAAAKAGISTIVVYWGELESGIENLATKTVSWVPLVGVVLPDEAQSMRIRLKVGLVDVRTGHWEMFTPKVLDERNYSARITRSQSDQAQVATLKKAAYKLAADGVVARYVK